MKTPETDLPTPRTDAFEGKSFRDRVDEMEKLYDFARELERENAELLAMLKTEVAMWDGWNIPRLDKVRAAIAKAQP